MGSNDKKSKDRKSIELGQMSPSGQHRITNPFEDPQYQVDPFRADAEAGPSTPPPSYSPPPRTGSPLQNPFLTPMNPFKDPAPPPPNSKVPSSDDQAPALPPRARVQAQAPSTRASAARAQAPAARAPAPQPPRQRSSVSWYNRNSLIRFLVGVVEAFWFILSGFIGPKVSCGLRFFLHFIVYGVFYAIWYAITYSHYVHEIAGKSSVEIEVRKKERWAQEKRLLLIGCTYMCCVIVYHVLMKLAIFIISARKNQKKQNASAV
ncbi:Protein of unknown function [Pyronema omphalodes CBS 100304]|uniref:Uncharacterized protein n=1 Tax=Pyronema omphalodes (strain CBS 100304) TaxID=1076935 RepID=U4LMG1_PYROM|nr:Protein of unknown function [Pyronema omphalodes CBS 100304]